MLNILSVSMGQKVLLTQNNLRLINALISSGFEPRFVGGCVRDALLGIKSPDIDISLCALPDETIKALVGLEGIKISSFAKRYGVIHAKYNGQLFQICTLREDIKTYGRSAEVMFTDSWEKDANRRDFTINAIYMGPSGEVIDFHNGMNDLSEGKVRFIGTPSVRIKEDFLRILRYFRFWGMFSRYQPNASLMETISENKCGLEKLSKDLINAEIRKIGKLNNKDQILSLVRNFLPDFE